MPLKPADTYGALAAQRAGLSPSGDITYWVNAAQLVIDMLTLGSSVKPGSMTSGPAPVNPAPVTGAGFIDPTQPDAYFGAIAAARDRCPPTSSQYGFYVDLAGTVRTICNAVAIPGSAPGALMATPAGTITGTTVIIAAAPAAAYATLAAAKASVPPPPPPFWTNITQLVLDVLADGLVNPLGLVGNPAGGPVTGAGSVA